MTQYPSKPTTADGTVVITLYCPLLSQSSTLLVPSGGDGKVDVGAVSRAFGLDPSTVRLNGHYLSRGPDLISRSITWATLLAYFEGKGIPPGREGKGGAVVVEGKPLRIGSKRGCEEGRGIDEGICSVIRDEDLVHKRVKKSSAHPCLRWDEAKGNRGSCLKRRCLLEDMNLLKRLKINDAPMTEDRCNGSGLMPPVLDTDFVCRVIGESVKRVRDDNPIVTSPIKLLR